MVAIPRFRPIDFTYYTLYNMFWIQKVAIIGLAIYLFQALSEFAFPGFVLVEPTDVTKIMFWLYYELLVLSLSIIMAVGFWMGGGLTYDKWMYKV